MARAGLTDADRGGPPASAPRRRLGRSTATNRWLDESGRVERAADGEVGRAARRQRRCASFRSASSAWSRTCSGSAPSYYVGDDVASTRASGPSAERLAKLVTDIDPHFDTAYVVMASVLNGLRKRPRRRDPSPREGRVGQRVLAHPLPARLPVLHGEAGLRARRAGAAARARTRWSAVPPVPDQPAVRARWRPDDRDAASSSFASRTRRTPEVREQLETAPTPTSGSTATSMRSTQRSRSTARKSAASRETVRALVDAGLLPGLPRDPKGGAYAHRRTAAPRRRSPTS